MRVEILLCNEDQTWTTEVVEDCPITEQDDQRVVRWARERRFTGSFYRKVVAMFVWAYNPEQA